MRTRLGWILLIVIFIFSLPVFADTVEIASVSAHYSHPMTGTVEDSGKDEAIGQGMTESVLDPQALIETDSQGRIFASFRLHLVDQIENYRVGVQKAGDSGFKTVNPTEMKRGSDFLDFRIPIPSKNSIIRVEAFIKAMGRPVIFYGKLNDRVEGNTDFIVSVDLSKTQNDNPPQSSLSSSENKDLESTKKEEPTNTSVTEEEQVEQALVEKPKEEPKEGLIDKVEIDSNHGLLMKGDPVLEGNYESVHPTEAPDELSLSDPEHVVYGPVTSFAIGSLFFLFGGISFMCFLGGIGAMVYFYLLRRLNDLREASLYGFKKK